MTLTMASFVLYSLLTCSLLIRLTYAHSWVERLMRVELNGTLVGPEGYIRGAVSRQDPGFRDEQMQNRIIPDDALYDDHICKSTQRASNYSIQFPWLAAHPGDLVAVQYQENGHVTLPDEVLKPSSGWVYIYGTSRSLKSDRLSEIHKVWNEEGNGGDQRGRLLAIRPFDDGRCYQINQEIISSTRQRTFAKTAQDPQGADLWCQNDFRLPLDIQNKYTIYWVWDWPSRPSSEFPKGKSEIYTSCADIHLLRGGKNEQVVFIPGQDLNAAAIQEQIEGR